MEETELLYNSRWVQIRTAAIGLLLGAVIVWKTYEVHNTIAVPGVGYFFGGLSLLIGSYFLRSLIIKQPEITLSNLGIDFQHDGFFSWDMIDFFSVVYYTGRNTYSDLIFHFRWRQQVVITLSTLQKDKQEVIALIQKWNTNPNFYYRGSSAE